MSESDGIEETLEQVIQHGMTISAQIGREVARVWRSQMENKAQLGGREASRLQLAFDAERKEASAALRPVLQQQWWEQASVPDVLRANQIAVAWQEHDPIAEAAVSTITAQVKERYGVDVADLVQSTPPLQVQEKDRAAAEDVERVVAPEGADAREVDVDASRDRQEGREQAGRADGDYSRARSDERDAAAAAFDGPSEEFEAWYRDEFMAEPPLSEEARTAIDAAEKSARQRENSGDRAATRSGLAFESAERKEALATAMRAAGAPEAGIQARQFAESQQKYPPLSPEASRGLGKTATKIQGPTQGRVKTQQRTR